MCLLEQAGFQKKLAADVGSFVADARSFRIEWEAHGPMVPGLDPMEAVDRLKKFQQPFEVCHPSTSIMFRKECTQNMLGE